MIEEKLNQGERKQPKSEKICASVRRELEGEKCSKTFCKISARQNRANAKHTSNSEEIFKSTKHFLENLNSKEDSADTTTSNVLSKIPSRKKTSQQLAFTCLKLTKETLEQGVKYVQIQQ